MAAPAQDSFVNFEEIWEQSLQEAVKQSTDPLRIFVNFFGNYIAEGVKEIPEAQAKIKELTSVALETVEDTFENTSIEDRVIVDAQSGTYFNVKDAYLLTMTEDSSEALKEMSDIEISDFARAYGIALEAIFV